MRCCLTGIIKGIIYFSKNLKYLFRPLKSGMNFSAAKINIKRY